MWGKGGGGAHDVNGAMVCVRVGGHMMSVVCMGGGGGYDVNGVGVVGVNMMSTEQ